ncbi:UDP-N-acetylmuramate dehydrogenase [Sporomusa malonica]|uniref:UDP-N-acetylenolpyruvoylglucosamine reductase n=2 Tax=Sporomusa malonica TaxID=112901 RepID=A0A1W2BSA6_9FIRM|nr:UDP-N-acetylmuramate dehydrogenase [Sporomusa malonica]
MAKNEILVKMPVEFAAELEKAIPPERLLVNEPMSKHTTFRIGGPADYLVFPGSVQEVAAVLDAAKRYRVPITVLGNGSNVLVLDRGIRGLVVKFGPEMGYIRHSGSTLFAGAGALLADVSKYAATNKLTGFEFAIGIPGSIGGAVFMNAGAYEGDMSQVVQAVTAVCASCELKRFAREELKFGYRHSVFQENGCYICEVELGLSDGEDYSIRGRIDDYTSKRESKQPLEMPSAGSTFKRPQGHFAGTLIEQAGLKGTSVGGAQVSTKHAGFIINAGGATAKDVLSLINKVQDSVYKQFGVSLHPEVRVLGEE